MRAVAPSSPPTRWTPTRAPRATRLVAGWVVTGLLAVACSGGGDGADTGDGAAAGTPGDGTGAPEDAVRRDRTAPLPAVTPTPQTLRRLGPDVAVPAVVDVIAGDGADEATRRLAADVLRAAGASDVRSVDPGEQAGGGEVAGLVVRVGGAEDPAIADELRAAGLDPATPLPAEGYALAAVGRDGGPDTVVVAGADAAGTFYGVQTLRQLVGDGTVAGVGVTDHPAMPLRGTVEGFYGSPWTHDERLDMLDFHGRFKLNTYIYAPKDDPYHRDRWRDPYPSGALDELAELVGRAAANHVRFTFAVSPGTSICFSDAADTEALIAKLRSVRDIGVRAFSIALDDIDHTRWNCDADASRYGPPSTEAAARAQVDLLNTVKRRFIDADDTTHPLQMVPTEYRGTDDSPYLEVLREGLDPAIEVMWTGTLVVPAEITIDHAAAAARLYGRPPFIWDNTPVNDYPATEGRLLLGPYDRREPGLSDHVRGIALNPMNQAAASKVALVGAADFTWNDGAYDPGRAHRAAAQHLAGGDPATVDALLAFFDLENLAPTSADSGALSLPQSPALAGEIDAFRTAWADGDRSGAIAGLRPRARLIAGAPGTIRRNVPDEGFLADCAPWLDATELWGRALVTTLDALEARTRGDESRADELLASADDLVTQAGAIETVPGATAQQGPVRVADGVLDSFLADAHDLR